MTNTKACTACKQIQLLTDFHKEARNKDGVRSTCKKCTLLKAATYRANNHHVIKESQAKTYSKHRDKRIANSKKWANANKDRRKQIEHKYRLAHKNEINQRIEQWRLKNVEVHRGYRLKRREALTINGIYEVIDKDLIRLYNSPCVYCGSKENIQADHVIPVTRGGRHGIGNLLPACKRCNVSKGNKLVSEWKLWIRKVKNV
jgi:5-methylcytosine-specific restriction endonuclease McrA